MYIRRGHRSALAFEFTCMLRLAKPAVVSGDEGLGLTA